MARSDEVEVPTSLGAKPPLLPASRPFDLDAVRGGILLVGAAATFRLIDHGYWPYIAALATWALVWCWPEGRSLWRWGGAWLRYTYTLAGSTFWTLEGIRRLFDADAAELVAVRVQANGSTYVVEPPAWWLVRHVPRLRGLAWTRHEPLRAVLAVEPEGSLALLADDERAARMAALAAALQALASPLQLVVQTRQESQERLCAAAVSPAGSPFAYLAPDVAGWMRDHAHDWLRTSIFATVRAADPDALDQRVQDAATLLEDAGMLGRRLKTTELHTALADTWGNRSDLLPRRNDIHAHGTDWVTVIVRSFPRHTVVGWLSSVLHGLRADLALEIAPDDARWLGRHLTWFQGTCMLPTADEGHHIAAEDLGRVDGKLRRNEDAVFQTNLTLCVPRQVLPQVLARLKKAKATYRLATFEHHLGRRATLPVGTGAEVGEAYPLDGTSVAAAYPFGASGLWMPKGCLIGRATDVPEAVTLDPLDPALFTSAIVVLGASGSGKSYLAKLLVARLGLPFTLVDQKRHVDARRPGEYYGLVTAAGGSYDVIGADWPEQPHPTAQGYNLSALAGEDARSEALLRIARREWDRALDTLQPRIFLIDEAWLLGRTEAGRLFLEEIARQSRAAGLIPIVISQEVSDFLDDPRLRAVVKNSDSVFVLGQEDSEVDIVADRLAIGASARAFLRTCRPRPNSEADAKTRRGLLRVGRRVVAVQIEASPVEHALFTTRPSDLRAMRSLAA